METVRQVQKKYCSRAMILAILGGLIMILAGHASLGKGLVLGTLFSVVNFVLIAEFLPLKLGRSRRSASLISLGSLLTRFTLMAVPLILAIKFTQFNLITVVMGLFLIQVVILADHLRKSRMLTRKSQV